MIEQEKENPVAGATATGQEPCGKLSGKPYIWGDTIASLKLEDSLWLKPKGWFQIETRDGETTLTVYPPGEPEYVIICLSPGHANQLRQELSDAGMAGLIKGGATWPNP